VITCPWCGTNYTTFQPNCRNCGGSLPLTAEEAPEPSVARITVPSPAPRDVPRNYTWRILVTDGWAIAGGILLFIGAVFGMVGIGLIIGVVTAFVGLPFAGLGTLLFVAGGALIVWRYGEAQKTVAVLRHGQAVLGEIVEVYKNFHVQVNGRHPWTVVYRYEVGGRGYEGRVTTLSRPNLGRQPGTAVYVLYAQGEPGQSVIYPHPYGYHTT
jgi:hypothetical protein